MNWSDPPVILATIGILITFAYTVLTWLIWDASRKNTQATREVLEAAHRPYIGIAGLAIQDAFDEDNEIRLVVSITNVGTVPARGIEIDVEINLSGKVSRRMGTSERPYIALFPGQTFGGKPALSREEVAFIAQSGCGLTVNVTVSYQGIGDKKYATYGGYEYDGKLQSFTVCSGNFD